LNSQSAVERRIPSKSIAPDGPPEKQEAESNAIIKAAAK
jgi:hypothetical protein